MDSTADNIYFDHDGVCNYCRDFTERYMSSINIDPVIKKENLNNFIKKVKENGKGKQYDCIIGVSGGVDSSWVLVKAVEWGLRPLAVHMDNGWNSELAQNNIENLICTLGVDLYTHVIDWHEYRGLMQAFFDSDVIDIELLYDNAMLSVNYQMARKYGLKHLLSGSNMATEGMRIPSSWVSFKYDKKNIKSISKSKGGPSLSTFPAIGTIGYIFNQYISGIKWVSTLDFIDFNKDEALRVLATKYNYKPYPFKHYESIFTRFYQGYLLPEKFGVDKRKVHLSTLMLSGQLSRESALDLLTGIAYESDQMLLEDKRYFLKKMDWSDQDLKNYLKRKEIPHSFYGSERRMWDFFKKIYFSIN